MRSGAHGFTLVELMIVIAIVAILAGIALPAVREYTYRAKRAELPVNVAGIQGAMVAYRSAHDAEGGCGWWPNATPDKTKRPWVGDPCWDVIGYEADGDVYGSYAVLGQQNFLGTFVPFSPILSCNCAPGDPFCTMGIEDVDQDEVEDGYIQNGVQTAGPCGSGNWDAVPF